MHAAFIFAALISSSASAVVSFSEGREFDPCRGFSFQVVPDSLLQEVVEGAVKSINRIAKASLKPEQKLMSIQETVSRVSIYRARSWSRSPSTEHQLDLQIGPYESFPLASNFSRKNCDSYYSTLKTEWEPSTNGAPTIKGVKQAWNNLKAICEE